jgi:hypothetical protein
MQFLCCQVFAVTQLIICIFTSSADKSVLNEETKVNLNNDKIIVTVLHNYKCLCKMTYNFNM